MVEVDEQSDGPNSKTCTNGILPYMSCIILGFAVNTTAYHSGLYSLHLLLLKRSMLEYEREGDKLKEKWEK